MKIPRIKTYKISDWKGSGGPSTINGKYSITSGIERRYEFLWERRSYIKNQNGIRFFKTQMQAKRL